MTNTPGRTALFLGLVALACTATPDRVLAPDRFVSDPNASFDRVDAAASGAQQRVTGHATILLPSFGNAEEKYSSSAIRHADGTVSGQFELKSAQDGGLRIHGDVVCFTIVGNTARIAGRVEQSNTTLVPEGTYVIWTVIDNGEGAKDPPDMTSDFFGPFNAAVAAAHCAVGFNLAPFLPVLDGNLQVHE